MRKTGSRKVLYDQTNNVRHLVKIKHTKLTVNHQRKYSYTWLGTYIHIYLHIFTYTGHLDTVWGRTQPDRIQEDAVFSASTAARQRTDNTSVSVSQSHPGSLTSQSSRTETMDSAIYINKGKSLHVNFSSRI